MQDKKVVVLANLKPRNMRGVKSCGMLMAASDASHENVELLVPPEGSIPGRIWFGSEDEKQSQPAAASPNQVVVLPLRMQSRLLTGNHMETWVKGSLKGNSISFAEFQQYPMSMEPEAMFHPRSLEQVEFGVKGVYGLVLGAEGGSFWRS
ncbi:hypothetical protein CK203_107472 [Vitis vinifera]|uniref:tRNA-binding domain-containing protein n=1 Tax=Vitis vinifera TaxID=29760 RepID=A0A438CEK9_VITVI|nr:hypothetical protein CK203_107472 [Vitis vinifera]